MNDKISIAIATFNGEKYIKDQLDSIYTQTLIPDEVIVVDDCSTDRTISILNEYKNTYGLKLYINNKNLGLNRNFEKAISLCTSDYIMLCDQDDVWFNHKIETTYNKIKAVENNKPTLVSSNCIDVDSNLKPIAINKNLKDADSYATTLLGHHSQGCTLMMNKMLVNKILPFPSDVEYIYDLYIGLTAAMIGNKYYIGEPLMFYRHHTSNVLGKDIYYKRTIMERIKNKYSKQYPNFIPDERFKHMRIVHMKNSNNFIKERELLFDKILLLENKLNLFNTIKIILSIKELAINRRVISTFNMLISKIIANFYSKY
ncbi:hypothetical protein SDC9_24997 [bioreactor metagenome]|uniref:Glycosyltransferase 2-like domain-containing protein n=1 Tax=bioreactor metagenome TaxID=1076179 RepID=A0A644UJU4_9ZZZZ